MKVLSVNQVSNHFPNKFGEGLGSTVKNIFCEPFQTNPLAGAHFAESSYVLVVADQ